MESEETEPEPGAEIDQEDITPGEHQELQRLFSNEDVSDTLSVDSSDTSSRGNAPFIAFAVVILCVYIVAVFVIAPSRNRSVVGEGLLDPPNVEDIVPPTLLISIDGFRHEYLSRRSPSDSDHMLAPNLYEIATKGVQSSNGLQPVVPTKTFPNHWSLVTGLYPENHGIVGNTMYDPLNKKWFHLDRMHPDWWFGEPIWQTIRQTPRIVRAVNGTRITLQENYTTGSVFWPGSDVPKHAASVFWKYDGDKPYEDRVNRAVSLLKGEAEDVDGRAHFVTIYFEGVDAAGHAHGPHSSEVEEEIKRVDDAIRLLLRSLGHLWYERYNLIVVSDHGMTQVSSDQLIDLTSAIKEGSTQDIVTSPMGFFLNMTVSADSLRDSIEKGFVGHEEHAKVYRKEDLPKRWRLRQSRLVTEVVTMASLGWTVWYPHQHLVPGTHNPLVRSSVPQLYGKGSHGYDNTFEDMQAIFIARGPSFRHETNITGLRALDLYEMICHIFGAHAAPNNGSLATTLSTILRS